MSADFIVLVGARFKSFARRTTVTYCTMYCLQVMWLNGDKRERIKERYAERDRTNERKNRQEEVD